MKFKRAAGVLLHPTALDTPYGIGDLGRSARGFVDLLAKASQSYWQVLPLTQANLDGCPYSSFGAFGGYDLLISPDELIQMELLAQDDIDFTTKVDSPVEFRKLAPLKQKLFRKAFEKAQGRSELQKKISQFKNDNSEWLEPYGQFMALTREYGIPWTKWPAPYRNRDFNALEGKLAEEAEFEVFKQFLFHKQWNELRAYAASKNVKFIGDLPIFVSHHSVDAWAWPSLFKLNDSQEMDIEVGAPPDCFNDKGQKWNNPNYDWDQMNENDFQWWKKRMHYMLDLVDVIRVDHFIGFYNVWEIPGADADAKNGQWVKSRGDEFLTAIREEFPDMPFIAEDLGEICQEAIDLRDKYDLPGMRVLQFAFDGDAKNIHHPDNIPENVAVYTGTHDNNTLKGQMKEVVERNNPDELEGLQAGFGENLLRDDIHLAFIEKALNSKGHTVVIPLQDILGLDEKHRFNMPGTIENNWLWRVPADCDLDTAFKTYGEMTIKADRENHG